MPKFKVTVTHMSTYDVTVEADNEDDAENEAIELVSGDQPINLTDEAYDIDSIEEIKAA